MEKINKLVRQNILNLIPYSSARDEFDGHEGIFLDANENPFGVLNRYPDPYQKSLKEKLVEENNLNINQVFIGNGSDEIIDLAFRIFCNPSIDKALTFSPTYGMYEVSANINHVELIKIPLNEDFQINIHSLNNVLNDNNLKLIFICSPNNPTGNDIDNIQFILDNFNGIVIIDEAYIHFSEAESYINQLNNYSNLIVLQTFSKAHGLAAARVGIAYACKEIIQLFNKIKPPYNVSLLNQQAAIDSINNINEFKFNLEIILQQKKWLIEQLNHIHLIKRIFPSSANFILVETADAEGIYNKLKSKKIITRNRNSVLKNCIRITVGTPFENQELINELKNITI
jgi:histidinol-phosphate aminotransferase